MACCIPQPQLILQLNRSGLTGRKTREGTGQKLQSLPPGVSEPLGQHWSHEARPVFRRHSLTIRNKKLLGAPGLTTRSKDATRATVVPRPKVEVSAQD